MQANLFKKFSNLELYKKGIENLKLKKNMALIDLVFVFFFKIDFTVPI